MVSALRIVEREFLIDQEVARRKIYSGFAPPGRPKCWRENLLEILKHNTEERIKLPENADKSQKGWVGKHLTKIRSSSVEDLINIKHLIQGLILLVIFYLQPRAYFLGEFSNPTENLGFLRHPEYTKQAFFAVVGTKGFLTYLEFK